MEIQPTSRTVIWRSVGVSNQVHQASNGNGIGDVLTVDKVVLTVFAEVNSLLNFRPLVYGGSSTSLTDVCALTPNHCLGVLVLTSSRVCSSSETCRFVVHGVTVNSWSVLVP